MIRPLRVVALLCLCAAAPAVQAQDPPNVLFIAIDDLNTAVGFLSEEPGNVLQTLYPDPVVRAQVRSVLTPNIDALAAQSAPFSRAHAPAALCAPSRAALMTGVRPHTSGFHKNGDRLRDNPVLAGVQTLPQLLKDNGYYTAGLGKIFHKWYVDLDGAGNIVDDWPDSQLSWSRWYNTGVGTGGTPTLSPWSPPGSSLAFGSIPDSIGAQPDVLNAEIIASVLRDSTISLYDNTFDEQIDITIPQDSAFFLAVGIYRPHLPFYVPQELLDLFDPADMALTDSLRQAFLADGFDLSEGGQEDISMVDSVLTQGRAKDLYDHAETIDPVDGPVDAWKDAVRHYLAGVALADRAVGRLIAALDSSDHADNTTVVLWGDHGFHLGQKSWFGKITLWDEGSQTTMVIRPPGGAASPGVLRNQLVSLIDLYPTIATMAGVPVPAHATGDDLAPVLADPLAPWDEKEFVTMGKKNHTIQTDQYQYLRYNEDGENIELYDMLADPHQETNLVGDPAYAEVIQTMNDSLDSALGRPVYPTGTGFVYGPAGYRLLTPGGTGLKVSDLANQNLVAGLPDQYPTEPTTLYTSYDGTGWTAASGMTENLETGQGFFWYLYDFEFTPTDPNGIGSSVEVPFALVVPQRSDLVETDVTLTLHADGDRYNTFGNPFPVELDLEPLATWPGGQNVNRKAYVWDPVTNGWKRGRQIGPWQGFMVRAKAGKGGQQLTIPVPSGLSLGKASGARGRIATEAPPPERAISFSLRGTDALTGRPLEDGSFSVSFADDARMGADDLDLPKLSAPAESYVSVGAQSPGGLLADDVRPSAPTSFEVPLALDAAGARAGLTLSWSLGEIPEAWTVTLRDLQTGRTIDLRDQGEYGFASRSAARKRSADLAIREVRGLGLGTRFMLSVDTGDAPEAVYDLALRPVAPNPTGDRARVTFSLAEDGEARVSVLDVRGREVAVLTEGPRPAGAHALTWRSSAFAPGVYVIRLAAGGEVLTRRAVVVR